MMRRQAIRFMGLLSPVGQMGNAPILSVTTFSGVQLNLGWPTNVSPNVRHLAQFLHRDEGDPQDMWFPETKILPTTHQSTHLSIFPTLGHGGVGVSEQVAHLMIDFARQVNVPVRQIDLP